MDRTGFGPVTSSLQMKRSTTELTAPNPLLPFDPFDMLRVALKNLKGDKLRVLRLTCCVYTERATIRPRTHGRGERVEVWAWKESNLRPRSYQERALPLSHTPEIIFLLNSNFQKSGNQRSGDLTVLLLLPEQY